MSVLKKLFANRNKAERIQAAKATKVLDIKAMQETLSGTGWKEQQPLFVPSGSLHPVYEASLASLKADVQQLTFLLASAPMLDAPSKLDGANWFKRVITPFGYIHPKTMAQYYLPTYNGRLVFVLPGSPTKWVMTSLMPEGRVLLSPFPMPGMERLLAK